MRIKESIIGCLTLRTAPISVPNYCKASAEKVDNPVTVQADSANTPVYIHIGNENGRVTCWTVSQNVLPKVEKRNQNIKVNITAALVCQVSLGVYEYFYVTEGPLIVEEGFFKVRRR